MDVIYGVRVTLIYNADNDTVNVFMKWKNTTLTLLNKKF